MSGVALGTRMMNERKRFEYAWWTHIFSKTEKKNLRFQDIRIGVDEVSKLLFFTVPNLWKNSLRSSSLRSSTEASFCRREGEGQEKRKRAGHDGKGKEKREACSCLFPLPIFPPRAFYFSIFLGYPAEASAEERAVTQQIPTDEKIVFFSCWLESPTH